MEDLREELAIHCAQRMRTTSDEVRRVVDALVDYIQQNYGGTELWVAKPQRDLPAHLILEDLRRGMSKRQVMSRYGITYRRLRQIQSAA